MLDLKFILAALAIAVIGTLFALVAARRNGKNRTGAYKASKLMTDNEAEFLGRLVVALPDYYVFPQVAMAALIEPSSKDRRQAHSDRLRIAQQRVDYVVCDKACKVIAVVELDDRTHSRGKDQTRDGRLLQGGIRTVRFESRNKPNAQALRIAILPPATMPELARTP